LKETALLFIEEFLLNNIFSPLVIFLISQKMTQPAFKKDKKFNLNERADLPEMDVQISNTQASISNKEFNIFENVPEKSNQKIR